MRFFDCSAYLGLPADPQVRPVYSTAEFVAAMDDAGIAKALVWHIAQHEYSPVAGNEYLAEEIGPHENLFGCWALLPDKTGELSEFFAQMKAARIGALRAFPTSQQFHLDRFYCGRLLGEISERRVPLLLSVRWGADYGTVHAVLREYEKLTCVVCDHGSFDRYMIPLLEAYPNLHFDTSFYRHQGALEPLVECVGASRILFGTGFPEVRFGSVKHVIEQADLPESDREAIAGGNLERLLSEAEL